MSEYGAKDSQVAELRSSLAWPLLGLLVARPSYGYELARRFERTYGDEIVVSGDVRIYKTLGMLSSRGLIEELPPEPEEESTSRQPKITYRATADGVRAYKEWLVSEAAEQHRRSLLFARQLVMLQPDAALSVIDRYELECLEEVEHAKLAEDNEATATDRNHLTRRLEQEDERVTLGLKLSWIEYARRELKAVIEERSEE